VEASAALQEETGELQVSAYPNPTYGAFQLQVKGLSATPYAIRITDMAGKAVVNLPNQKIGATITVGQQLRSGIYFAEVQQGTQRKVIKLVKQ
jgi:hypothetical protein